MAEGFEAYHVPQQSRRDKLRVGGVDYLPLYDPSDFLTCAALKEEGGGGGGGGVNFMDPPQSSLFLNPNSVPNPFLFTPQNLRILDQTFNGGFTATATEPNPNVQGLSLSLSSSSQYNNQSYRRFEPSISKDKVSVSGGGYVVPAVDVGNRSSVPLGPFTGYASVLKGSRYLRPAEQLMQELCDAGTVDSSLMESPMESFVASVDHSVGSGVGRKKSRLISMLDEVYSRYKHYYEQIQAVVASFQSVAGLNNAAPYVNLALNAMSKHFRCLKNAIIDQIQFANKVRGHVNYQKDESSRFGNPDRSLYSSQGQITNAGFPEHHQPVWRPQRGLPECAVTVLRAWLFEHFLHPYPTDTDKLMLAKQTGLTRSQVSNWFINARVRLWKPMVEEIHMLETRQAQKGSSHSHSQREEQNTDRPVLPTMNSLVSDQLPSTSCQRTTTQDHLSSKRTRSQMSLMGTEDPMALPYEHFSHHNRVGNGVGTTSRGVSLTLGLHHSNSHGIVLQEPFRVTDQDQNGYVIGGFDATNPQFGREIIGGHGQLLRDFVG